MAMMTTEATESVARPAAQVFAFIADIRNDPRWHTDVLRASLAQGEVVRAGSVFEIQTKPVMGISGGTVTVSAYDPPSRIVFDVQMGKLTPTTTFTVLPDGQGCRVTRRIEMEPQGLMRVMAPFMGGKLRSSNAGFLANLKRVLEIEADRAQNRP
jgi:carbon monoxide dehydrogenase subunit G